MVRAHVLAVLGLVLLLGCAEEFQGRPPLTDGLHYPMTTAVDPTNGRLYVVNSNFDLAYQAASIVSFDLATHRLTEGSVSFGAFPGSFLLVDSVLADARFGFLAVRGDNSLTWFKVDESGDGPVFVCSDDADDPGTCSGSHVLTESELLTQSDGDPLGVGSDPFGLGFLPGHDSRPDRLLMAAMKGGELSLLELSQDGVPALIDQVYLAGGLHSVAIDPATEVAYLTNKQYPLLYRYSVGETDDGGQLTKRASVTLPAPFSSVQYGRGLTFAKGGQRILVTYRTPASLLFVDGADVDPALDQVVVTSVPVGSKPGNVVVVPSGLTGGEIAYVPCYADDTLWAIDVATATPVAVIPVGSGPYDVSAVFTAEYRRAYITNFLGHTVSVVDIDPSSPFYHTHIAEVH